VLDVDLGDAEACLSLHVALLVREIQDCTLPAARS